METVTKPDAEHLAICYGEYLIATENEDRFMQRVWGENLRATQNRLGICVLDYIVIASVLKHLERTKMKPLHDYAREALDESGGFYELAVCNMHEHLLDDGRLADWMQYGYCIREIMKERRG